ncbi:hypothetical protein IW140_002860 [Coemansia sp. RSA 1813]|nr:hypothetical protein EV178_002778 [Coemansia sp. RSA 1646]KAJ2569779.1 hypothetical protein IW140_002860 [Coemansia sp. RSA 1813]
MARGASTWLKTRDNETLSAACNRSKAESKKGKTKRQRPKTMAELADKHQLYQQAVQHPRKEVRNLDSIYRKLSSRYLDHSIGGSSPKSKKGQVAPEDSSENASGKSEDDTDYGYVGRRQAQSLREDFCGTAVLCAEWVNSASSANRYAYGVDIDPEVIEYAKKHTVEQQDSLDSAVDDRITLVCADVLDVHGDDNRAQEDSEHAGERIVPRVDIIASFNYAMCYFHKRCDLVRYMRHSLGNLNDFGLLFCDLFGGHEAVRSGVTRVRNVGSFKYHFRQNGYDLMRGTIRFSLSFRMQDGSMLKDCFTYDFRVYSLCELREAMLEAGFDDVCVWISTKNNLDSSDDSEKETESSCSESEDGRRGSADFGEFEELVSPAEMPESFNAYVIGVKLPANETD